MRGILMSVLCICGLSRVEAYTECESGYVYLKKGGAETQNSSARIVISPCDGTAFEFSKKDSYSDQDEGKSSMAWNLRTGKPEFLFVTAGNYHAKFSSGLILSRINSSLTNPFLSSSLRAAVSPFVPESNAAEDDSLFGLGLSFSPNSGGGISPYIHLFHSFKKSFVLEKEYDENETDRNILSLTTSVGSKKESPVSVHLSGASVCAGCGVFRLSLNGITAQTNSYSGRIRFKNSDRYSVCSMYLSAGTLKSEIFCEIAAVLSEESRKNVFPYQCGLKHTGSGFQVSFVRKSIPFESYLPFGSPCGGKTPSVMNVFRGYLFFLPELKAGGEIVQTEYLKESLSRTHSLEESVFAEYRLFERIILEAGMVRIENYAAEREVSKKYTSTLKIYFKWLIIENSLCKSKTELKLRSEAEFKCLSPVVLKLNYVNVKGSDQYYETKHNLSSSVGFVSKDVSILVRLNTGFGDGTRYSGCGFSISSIF